MGIVGRSYNWWLSKPKVIVWWHYNVVGGFTESFMKFVDKQISELNKRMIEKESKNKTNELN